MSLCRKWHIEAHPEKNSGNLQILEVSCLMPVQAGTEKTSQTCAETEAEQTKAAAGKPEPTVKTAEQGKMPETVSEEEQKLF